jgi:acetyl esterase/lipase
MTRHRRKSWIRFLALAGCLSLLAGAPVPGVDSPPPAAAADTRGAGSPAAGSPAAGAAPAPTLADVAYGSHPRQVLDFWKAEAARPTPLVFYIHGGGWMPFPKDKTVVVTHGLADYLAAGVSVVSINYRLVSDAQAAGVKPPVQWPMHDAARALQFVRAKAAEWGLDKARIGLFGGSAGACTSLWLALHDEMAEPGSPDPVARESTRPSCVAVAGAQTSLDPEQMRRWIPNSVYGGHAFGFDGPWTADVFQRFYEGRDRVLPWIKEYSPIEWASAGDPPVFLQYDAPPAAAGQVEKDPTHSAVFGTKLQQRLREVGVECHLSYPGSPETEYRSRYEFLVDRLSK